MLPSLRNYTKIVHQLSFRSDSPLLAQRISKNPVKDLVDIIKRSKRLLVITGAGASTDSGVPDYRGRNGTYVRNPDHRPITYQEFMNNEAQQKRYWVRGLVGFDQFSRAQPNTTHKSLRALEVFFASQSAICNIVTQNVDRLHHKAGSMDAIELHGSAFTVNCTSCSYTVDRQRLHSEIFDRNSTWLKQVGLLKSVGTGAQVAINPDGDADVVVNCSPFILPSCPRCSSILKPSVVFFGENVPEMITKRTLHLAATADAILVIGSTLATYSSLRLVRLASAAGNPVAILNDSGTRGDENASILLREQCGGVMSQVLKELS